MREANELVPANKDEISAILRLPSPRALALGHGHIAAAGGVVRALVAEVGVVEGSIRAAAPQFAAGQNA